MKINYRSLKAAMKARLSNKAFSLSLIAFVVGISIFAYGAVRAGSPTDCDSMAVIRCGVYDKNVMINQYNANTNGVKDLFNHFQINGDFSGTVDGTVTKDNKVIVAGQVVATNVLTAGRENIGSSEPINLGGTTFYKRQPSVSFAAQSIPAYVKIVNGQFKWAVIKSCGNPVWGTPTSPEVKPDVKLKKYVGSITKPTGYYDANSTPINVNAGDTITYDIKITNSGNGPANNLTIGDQVESNIGSAVELSTLRLTSATTVPGAKVITQGGKKWIVSSAFNLQPGQTLDVEFTVKVKASYSGTFDNIGCLSIAGVALPVCDNAKVTVPPVVTPPPTPTPSYLCTNLTVAELSRTSFKFSAAGEAKNGATITGYIFKVNGATVYNNSSSSFTYNQTKPGTYTVKAYVKTNKGTTGEVAVCTKQFTVKPAPEIPSYTIKKYVQDQDAQDNNTSVQVEAGKEFTYKVVVKNTSTKTTINSIKVWDVLPTGVSYVDDSLKLGTQTVSNDNDFFNAQKGINVSNLAAGKEAVFTFKAKINASSDQDKAEMCASNGTFYNNIAKADPAKQGSGESQADLPEKQDPAVVKCSFTPNPRYTIKKYVEGRDAQNNNSAVSVDPNQEFTYKVVLENTGNVKLNNVKAWDVLPTGVSYVDDSLKLNGQAITNDNDFFNTQKGINISSMSIGQKVEFTFKAKINASSDQDKAEMCASNGTFYNNIAKADPESATGTNANDPQLAEKQDPAVVKCSFTPPVKHPSVIIEKEVSEDQVTVGQQFTWFVTVTNNGDVDLTNVVISDKAPANTQFVSAADVDGVAIEMTPSDFKATIASLKIGAEATIAIQAKATKYQQGQITNTACVNAPEVNPSNPNKDDDCDDAEITIVKEKCPIPGKQDLDKDDNNCKEVCPIPGKQNLAKDDKNCRDQTCIEVGGKVISTVGKDGCNETSTPTKIATPNATPSTGLEVAGAAGATLSLSAAAYAGTLHFRKRAGNKKL